PASTGPTRRRRTPWSGCPVAELSRRTESGAAPDSQGARPRDSIAIASAEQRGEAGCSDEETTAFARAYFALRARTRGDGDQSELYRILDPVKQRFQDHLDAEKQEQVRSDLDEFV